MFSFIPYFILQAIYNIHIEIVFNAINRFMHSMMLITNINNRTGTFINNVRVNDLLHMELFCTIWCFKTG